MIYESVVTTVSAQGDVHIAPMGLRYDGDIVVLMPFLPSKTYDNVVATRHAVANFTTDTRVFAGCISGRRRSWPVLPATRIEGMRLDGVLGHAELELIELRDDAQRPTLRMRRVHDAIHASFVGFNRAQAAVIEGAILVSRLDRLPRDKIEREMAYLQIAIDKTAAPNELEAWQWLQDAVREHIAGRTVDER